MNCASKNGRPTALSMVDGVDLTGKSCVITGASSGLGKASARALAAANAHVILAARNREALIKAEMSILSEQPTAQVTRIHLDLGSLKSVRIAAAEIDVVAPAIHVLINNAGVMFTPFTRTAEGFELQFGTNHLGHFALTQLLTPNLLAAEGARIVNLSSEAHHLSDVDLSDPCWQGRDYDKFRAYGASKTANVLHAVELEKRLRTKGIRSFAVHPGMVATKLSRHMTKEDVDAVGAMREEASEESSQPARLHHVLTPQQGAATQVWAAVDPDLSGTDGVYLKDCREAQAADYATDPDHAGKLWEMSQAMCERS